MGPKFAKFCLAMAIFLAANICVSPAARAQVNVFAAASLSELIGDIGREFERETGIKILVSTAGSSTLARQIIAGAPVDIFISANPDLITQVQKNAGFGVGRSLFYNRLVVVGPPSSDKQLTGLENLPIVMGEDRLAMGDPSHVPAGIYAKQALENVGVWDQVSHRLAPASSVRAALRLVQAGAAQLGIVYASDLRGTDLISLLEIDPKLHQQIIYVGALASNRKTDEGAVFLTFLGSDFAKNKALEFGFSEKASD